MTRRSGLRCLGSDRGRHDGSTELRRRREPRWHPSATSSNTDRHGVLTTPSGHGRLCRRPEHLNRVPLGPSVVRASRYRGPRPKPGSKHRAEPPTSPPDRLAVGLRWRGHLSALLGPLQGAPSPRARPSPAKRPRGRVGAHPPKSPHMGGGECDTVDCQSVVTPIDQPVAAPAWPSPA
jgi:hypothetical protein